MNLPDLIGPIVNTEPEVIHSPKAILWGQDDLLAQAIGSFLKDTEWCVTYVPNDGDVEKLIREIRRINPEVVILCGNKAEDSAIAFRLIEEQPFLKVITLGLDSNHMQVYRKQNVLLREASDLLSILENGNFPHGTPGKEANGTKSI